MKQRFYYAVVVQWIETTLRRESVLDAGSIPADGTKELGKGLIPPNRSGFEFQNV